MPASSVAATQSLEANTRSKKTASPPAQETHCLLHKKSSKAVDFRRRRARRALREPVSVNSRTGLRPAEMELENRAQRPAPEILPARTEIPKITDQRLGRASLTRGNVADSHAPGNNTPGREDSNLRMAESKSAALPLGDALDPVLRARRSCTIARNNETIADCGLRAMP